MEKTSSETMETVLQENGRNEATLPDPSVLLKSLQFPCQLVGKTDAQATFRLSQERVSLEVDAKPTTKMVGDFSECLLADLDSPLLLQGVDTHSRLDLAMELR